MIDQKNYSLLRHNTFGIDAKCKRFIEYSSVEEAQQVAGMITDADRPLLILGGGSNLLLTGDYNGTVLHSGIRFLEQTDECHVRCGSGFIWDDVVDYCVANNLYGAENLSIIPGEVGASAVQNIGDIRRRSQRLNRMRRSSRDRNRTNLPLHKHRMRI